MRVETLGYGPRALLERRGLRDHMIRVLMGLDVWLDQGRSLDDDFWGLLRSEVGRRGLSCDALPGPVNPSASSVGTVVVLDRSNLATVTEAAKIALDHWAMRGHSRELTIDLGFLVAIEGGMERAEVRGPIGAVVDALEIGSDGFSEVGRGG
jgi:hypothetical protein